MSSRRNSLRRHMLGCLVFAVLLCGAAVAQASSPVEAQQQQQQAAVQRFKELLEQFRRTLDSKPLQSTLESVDAELSRSGEALRVATDDGGLALALITRGEIWRVLEQYAKAADLYAEAAQVAGRAGHAGHEADAWSGRARTKLLQGELGPAAADAERALPLARAAAKHETAGDALGVLVIVRAQQKDFDSALAHSKEQFSAASLTTGGRWHYLAHWSRGLVYWYRFDGCDRGGDIAPCLEDLAANKADLEIARVIARTLQYTAVVKNIDSMLKINAELREATLGPNPR